MDGDDDLMTPLSLPYSSSSKSFSETIPRILCHRIPSSWKDIARQTAHAPGLRVHTGSVLSSWYSYKLKFAILNQVNYRPEDYLLGFQTLFPSQCLTNWTMKQTRPLPPWYPDIGFLVMLYRLNYEANPNIVTLAFEQRFHCSALITVNALPSELWRKSEPTYLSSGLKHCLLDILASLQC